MDSHHTNKTYQEEYKEQFQNMTDEQIEQRIVMERGGNILRCWMKIRYSKATNAANNGELQNYKG